MRIAVSPLLASLALTLLSAGTCLAQQPGALTLTPKQSEAAGAANAAPVRLYSASKALVIGINKYEAGWPKLSVAIPDAEAVAKALQARGFAVTLKKDLRSDELDRTLKDFFVNEGADPETGLILWFAGHGHTVNGEGYIVPADAPDPKADTQFRSKAISLRRFGEYMREAKSKHVLAIFDSCFAGSVFNVARSNPPAAITTATAQPVRQFISSGEAEQEVSDDGTFRKLFIAALNGEEPAADANRDGYVTGTELGLFLQDKLTNLTQAKQTPRYGKLNAMGLDRGDYVFSIGPVAATSAPAPAIASVRPDTVMRAPTAAPTTQVPAVTSPPVQGAQQPPAPPVAAPTQAAAPQAAPKTAIAPSPPAAAPAAATLKAIPESPVAATAAATGATARTAPGTVFRDCPTCPEMVVLPPGKFEMGSTAESDEQPVRTVTIRPFAVSRFEVTEGDWEACLAAGGCGDYEPWGTGKKPTSKQPVANVSFSDAKIFMAWLAKQTGKPYRLLSEAEWEYAARAGTTTRYPWGRDAGAGQANCTDCGSSYNGRIAPAGSFPPNPFGLYDMHGNLWEWVEDCYLNSYGPDIISARRFGPAPTDGSARIDDGACKVGGSVRVSRGGAYNDIAGKVRSSARYRWDPRARNVTLGFRVARTLD